MLRICTDKDYRKYADFVYGLAKDPSKSGYPSYSDGIKTKEMFLERSGKAFSRETEDILLFEYEGAVEGWIHYYFIPEDNYLSTVSFNISSHTEVALREFLEFAKENFKGYELFLGFSADNKAAVSFLSGNGFECIEDTCNNTALLNDYEPVTASEGVIAITKENYELFAALHRQAEGDMYWNSERIYQDIDNWLILAKICSGEAVGSVYCMDCDDGWFEIFGVDMKDCAFDPVAFEQLLTAALNAAKQSGGKIISFFCEKHEQETVSKLGFKFIGEYLCYKKQII